MKKIVQMTLTYHKKRILLRCKKIKNIGYNTIIKELIKIMMKIKI